MNLYEARSFYTLRGYEYVDVPTLVERDVINSTIPEEAKIDWKPKISPPNLYHVASGEQGFISLYLCDLLPKNKNKLQTITACYRPCDKDRGELYQEWFIKLELFSYNSDAYIDMIKDARDCYSMFFNVRPSDIEIAHTKIGLDLLYNGIEIGSYGSRKLSFKEEASIAYRSDDLYGSIEPIEKIISFSYGTGYVPYRLDKAIAKNMI